jgi:hypothetical protein
MGTFNMWLEAKNNGLNENQIDDHKLVAMLNEAFKGNRRMILQLAESDEDVVEIEEKLKEKAPSVHDKVKGLGRRGILAAAIALGLGVPGMFNQDFNPLEKAHQSWLKSDIGHAVEKAHRLEKPYQANIQRAHATEKSMNDRDAAEKKADMEKMDRELKLRNLFKNMSPEMKAKLPAF